MLLGRGVSRSVVMLGWKEVLRGKGNVLCVKLEQRVLIRLLSMRPYRENRTAKGVTRAGKTQNITQAKANVKTRTKTCEEAVRPR